MQPSNFKLVKSYQSSIATTHNNQILKEMSRVNEILQKYSLNGPYPQEKYISTMEQRFKKRGVKFMNLVDKYFQEGFTPSKWKKLYNEKNSHEGMSIYISSHTYTPIFQKVLAWLEQNIEEEPDSFIELGCENGLFTICLSDLWGNANAKGLDQLGSAISIARNLAGKNAKQNVKFYYFDLTKVESCKEIPKSSLVIAPFIFHELMDQPQNVWKEIGLNILSLLEENGKIISFNRFDDPNFYNAILDNNLSLVGLEPTERDEIKVGWETFPITIFQRK